MNLYNALEGLTYTSNIQDCEISSICSDSRQFEPGCVFVCINGFKFDGHDHAAEALCAGAAAVVVQRDLGLDRQIIVEDSRRAFGILCCNFYGNPSKKLKLIGVTGTNGKTTITYLIKHILEAAGKKVGLLGTIKNEIGDMSLPSRFTTPDAGQLQGIFARMVEAGCEYVVMEVSSHALDQQRLAGCRFQVAIFTNLTQDHLDYHGDMKNYYDAKRKLFDMCDNAVINIDDRYGRQLLGEITCPVKTFSVDQDRADYTAKEIRLKASGSAFTFVGKSLISRMSFNMPGLFSVSNAMAAATAMLSVGLSMELISAALASCEGVSGRTEVIKTDTDFTVIRDYAHTPDSLEKILSTIKQFTKGRLVTIGGCAGNRDKSKRPIMGEVLSRLSDFVIVSSDNPRDEDPMQIINDVLPGVKKHKTPYKILPDRYEAIEWALDNCRTDDVLVMLGKGHEDYQVVSYGTIYFDEKEIVLGLLKAKREGGK